jgi:GNAT superfamily N-acetyltransferase
MSSGSGGSFIREVRPGEFAQLREIELQADKMFEEVGIGPFQNSDAQNHLDVAALVLAAEEPPVGFICVEVVEGIAHIWQLAVLPGSQGRGLGSALIAAVCGWAISEGIPAVTLTTYRDIPWNGPFYRRRGFQPIEHLSPGLTAIRNHERDVGDDDFGRESP